MHLHGLYEPDIRIRSGGHVAGYEDHKFVALGRVIGKKWGQRRQSILDEIELRQLWIQIKHFAANFAHYIQEAYGEVRVRENVRPKGSVKGCIC